MFASSEKKTVIARHKLIIERKKSELLDYKFYRFKCYLCKKLELLLFHAVTVGLKHYVPELCVNIMEIDCLHQIHTLIVE